MYETSEFDTWHGSLLGMLGLIFLGAGIILAGVGLFKLDLWLFGNNGTAFAVSFLLFGLGIGELLFWLSK